MARPIYGGLVTFTAHLSIKNNYDIYKIGNNTEKNKRKYGYGVKYQNTIPIFNPDPQPHGLCAARFLACLLVFISAVDSPYVPELLS